MNLLFECSENGVRDLFKDNKLVCLELPDQYERVDPHLVRFLESKVEQRPL